MEHLPTSTLLVTAEVIQAYAELTQDFNPLHLDANFAASTPMGNVIAHGTMSINLVYQSIARAFGEASLEDTNLDIRLVRPVRIGEVLVAGGFRSGDDPHQLTVWVRGTDGEDRLVGSATLGLASTPC